MSRRCLLLTIALLEMVAVAPAHGAPETVAAGGLELTASFVSSVGWVKPGGSYPLTVSLRNPGGTAVAGARVTVSAPAGTRLTAVRGPGGPVLSGGAVTWAAPTIDAGRTQTIVVEARALTLGQDPELAWKDVSSTATLTIAGQTASSRTHGPRVIPPSATYETARYGDRPFPVVPVDYLLRTHAPANGAEQLDKIINDPATLGSTFNLYQEMSYGQLFPHGTVPSAGVEIRDWSYGPGFGFTDIRIGQTCLGGLTLHQAIDTPLLPNRILDGWYQLPGNTEYYGADANGSALIGALAGVGSLQSIDGGCGPAGKIVYDAAQISDPEIDFNDYDTDKDGTVDFFMVIFAGVGGNGESQTNAIPPYDNVWPNSGNLEEQYTDPATGLKGYVSDDQLKDLEGNPLFYTDDSYARTTTTETPYKVFVRVGPYNLNPESAIQKASVISHEYGHSLGLPDYYSTGSRVTYGTWNLMAEDHSQNMSAVAKQQLGWLIPRQLGAGQTLAKDWADTKKDVHEIRWQTRAGKPYTLRGPGVHNGQAYGARLPGRQILDPGIVPSGTHTWWSGAGNSFGCAPTGGHNLDIAIPGLAQVAPGTPVTLTLKHAWQIEWDYDYGFVLTTTDGKRYTSVASQNGYTNPATTNPGQNNCQGGFGNGITGSPGSFSAGTAVLDRVLGNYDAKLAFVDDAYDISSLAGTPGIVRFSYATDVGLAKQGWFIDDIKVTAGNTVLYESDFERQDEGPIFNGGCRDDLTTATKCTRGWNYVSSDRVSPADRAYYLELRDRSGFDDDGHGQDDRGSGPTFAPGLLLEYTDEFRGDGNVGVDDPPAVSPLDARPEPGSATPNLDDAAFKATERFSDSGNGHVDNYTDPARPDGLWRFDFDCLTFTVDRMAGGDVGPSTAPGDLNGDVTLTGGAGCGAWDYGYADLKNLRPTAAFSAPAARLGEATAFEAATAFDDLDGPDKLAYAWDFTGDGKRDASGRSVRRTFRRTGKVRVRLTVTDSGGLTDTVTKTVRVVRGRLLASVSVPSRVGARLRVRVRLGATATVRVLVQRGKRVVATTRARTVRRGRRAVIVVSTSRLRRRGSYTVRVLATAGKRRDTVTRRTRR